MSTISHWHTTATAISTRDCYSCPVTLGITPNCDLSGNDTDLVFSVLTANGKRFTLSNATVEWVARDSDGNTIITRTTADYSIITFGNTLVVHLNIGEEYIPDETLYYTATITTTDPATYTMTGALIVTLIQHVTIERLRATLQEPKPRMGAVVAQRMIALHGATQTIRLEGISREPMEPRIAGQRELQKPLQGGTREIRIRGALKVIRADCVFPQNPRMTGTLQEFKEN